MGYADHSLTPFLLAAGITTSVSDDDFFKSLSTTDFLDTDGNFS